VYKHTHYPPLSLSRNAAALHAQAGILRLASRQLWRGRLSAAARPQTQLQRDVGAAVRALGVDVAEEFEGAEYSIDLAIPAARVAIEGAACLPAGFDRGHSTRAPVYVTSTASD